MLHLKEKIMKKPDMEQITKQYLKKISDKLNLPSIGKQLDELIGAFDQLWRLRMRGQGRNTIRRLKVRHFLFHIHLCKNNQT